jgi:hypothetical protein
MAVDRIQFFFFPKGFRKQTLSHFVWHGPPREGPLYVTRISRFAKWRSAIYLPFMDLDTSRHRIRPHHFWNIHALAFLSYQIDARSRVDSNHYLFGLGILLNFFWLSIQFHLSCSFQLNYLEDLNLTYQGNRCSYFYTATSIFKHSGLHIFLEGVCFPIPVFI